VGEEPDDITASSGGRHLHGGQVLDIHKRWVGAVVQQKVDYLDAPRLGRLVERRQVAVLVFASGLALATSSPAMYASPVLSCVVEGRTAVGVA